MQSRGSDQHLPDSVGACSNSDWMDDTVINMDDKASSEKKKRDMDRVLVNMWHYFESAAAGVTQLYKATVEGSADNKSLRDALQPVNRFYKGSLNTMEQVVREGHDLGSERRRGELHQWISGLPSSLVYLSEDGLVDRLCDIRRQQSRHTDISTTQQHNFSNLPSPGQHLQDAAMFASTTSARKRPRHQHSSGKKSRRAGDYHHHHRRRSVSLTPPLVGTAAGVATGGLVGVGGGGGGQHACYTLSPLGRLKKSPRRYHGDTTSVVANGNLQKKPSPPRAFEDAVRLISLYGTLSQFDLGRQQPTAARPRPPSTSFLTTTIANANSARDISYHDNGDNTAPSPPHASSSTVEHNGTGGPWKRQTSPSSQDQLQTAADLYFAAKRRRLNRH